MLVETCKVVGEEAGAVELGFGDTGLASVGIAAGAMVTEALDGPGCSGC